MLVVGVEHVACYHCVATYSRKLGAVAPEGKEEALEIVSTQSWRRALEEGQETFEHPWGREALGVVGSGREQIGLLLMECARGRHRDVVDFLGAEAEREGRRLGVDVGAGGFNFQAYAFGILELGAELLEGFSGSDQVAFHVCRCW
jgi:hypothetical protein